MTIKYALILALAAFVMPGAKAAMIDFHFGRATQTGAGVLGNAGDIWNTSNATNGGPVLLNDVAGQPTTVALAWTSGDPWAVTATIHSNATGTDMDPSTAWLMNSFATSYAYKIAAPTNLALSLTGLAANQAYSLVIFGAGDQKNEGTQFTVVGKETYTGTTTGLHRKLSAGPGNAYVVIQAVSSASGALKITTLAGGYRYAFINGFQLVQGQATAPTPVVAITPPPTPTTTVTPPATTAKAAPIAWGVCGHPTWSDYASWIPANVTTQMNYMNQLGCKYYRVSFEGAEYPQYLDTLVPKAQTAGITLLPNLPVSLKPSDSAQVNYNANYQLGLKWATYAISKGYAMPYWELGNELENDGLVKVIYDGASPNDFPDEKAGGFVAIASGLSGAYQGIKDGYTAGRKSGLTTITPQVLIGATFRHWGLLSKIQTYNNGFLPCDIISWHWYGPNYGAFNTPIKDPNSVSNGRTPAECLGDFKSHTDSTKPMDIWITETNRSAPIYGGGLLNGSVVANATPKTSQDWAAQATAIQNCVDSFKAVPSVKGIFVYELLDEPIADGGSPAMLAGEGYFGLVTGLNGTPKNAFYTYQAEIKAGR